MKITAIHFKKCKDVTLREFRGRWLAKRKRKLHQTKAEAVLIARGIQVVDAKDVIRPAVIEELVYTYLFCFNFYSE